MTARGTRSWFEARARYREDVQPHATTWAASSPPLLFPATKHKIQVLQRRVQLSNFGERIHLFLLTNSQQKRSIASFSRASPSRTGAGDQALTDHCEDRNQSALVPGDAMDHFIPREMKWEGHTLTH